MVGRQFYNMFSFSDPGSVLALTFLSAANSSSLTPYLLFANLDSGPSSIRNFKTPTQSPLHEVSRCVSKMENPSAGGKRLSGVPAKFRGHCERPDPTYLILLALIPQKKHSAGDRKSMAAQNLRWIKSPTLWHTRTCLLHVPTFSLLAALAVWPICPT